MRGQDKKWGEMYKRFLQMTPHPTNYIQLPPFPPPPPPFLCRPLSHFVFNRCTWKAEVMLHYLRKCEGIWHCVARHSCSCLPWKVCRVEIWKLVACCFACDTISSISTICYNSCYLISQNLMWDIYKCSVKMFLKVKSCVFILQRLLSSYIIHTIYMELCHKPVKKGRRNYIAILW